MLTDELMMSTGTKTEYSYEEHLQQDKWWGVSEGGRYFAGEGKVHETLRRLTTKLRELDIHYAVVGGMALYFHGFARFTDDVDLLVNRDELSLLQSKLIGLGYRPLFAGSKNLRDTESGVKIEFLISGDYPGDGKPKPVAFPDPARSGVEIQGIQILQLPKLIELKIASGMSLANRMRDLADVIDLIETLRLPESIADSLDESVREKYRELWIAAQDAREP